MTVREWVLHVDLDQFIAAVEVARRPELRGKPVVVGGNGDPTERAVVATASYEAREFGIQSGMPLRTAAKRCPEAIFLATDAPAYQEVSDRVMATLREFPVVVEVLGWDEAFLGAATDDPEALAADIRRVVAEETGLSCSVGVGDNKLRAKLATGFAKPAGVFRLVQENWWDVMAERPTDALWGIGAKTTKKLAAAGYHTVLDLAGAEAADLAARFGPKLGPWYRILAGGIGDAEVTATPYVARSRSRETTFQQNLTDPEAMAAEVVALAKRVSQDVADEGRPAARVAVKIRFAPFLTHTHSVTLPAPTADPGEIEKAALAVLDMFDLGRPVRLLGVRAEFSAAAARSTSP
ncbi:DNA polymerase IV [Amycolatopsis regifaucium]|uniref:DNA polymerase IV n=1 Tax=Amycolatopsis regifaucium TaxID=546365 RepID=A0A154MPI1_9PSEU|nr:DNA polymerase IV [Amycolatopsis regifaucium]KZB86212.1 DNA polymerase IV [Amycolatopsis regifaucium]OKA05102.1 DNA polymerase IV [Amycolatopsis regifaucium]SFH82126.1 DNA polymerase-4 [Amycolatopsis regifaucium]